ncbi:MAG: hypothetical protein A2X86_20100 [Bdellovibrionales bacterium GWA2_49_15]|nr:MAG: hypothetical protein A2X86_20100 [Bdellovibrionales bacterium GWA2_49_15]HAZ11385.1 hypothetical protein [Bdellovibrionales bacterium]
MVDSYLSNLQNSPAQNNNILPAELATQYTFVNAVVENIPDMIFVKDAKELRFIRFNKAGEELLGYGRDELIGKNDYDLFSKEEADFFTSKDRAVLASGKLLDIPEEPIQTHQKGLRILHTKKIPIYNDEGRPEFLLGISEDITEKKRTEEQRQQLLREEVARSEAEKALQLRDEFFAVISHELRTPLNSLSLVIQLLERKLKDKIFVSANVKESDSFGEVLGKAQAQVSKISSLLEDFLDVSRIRKGKLSIQKMSVNLFEIIKKCVSQFEGMTGQASVPIEIRIDDGIVGQWDPARIEQIISNLLSNAIKYGDGKPIEIFGKVEGNTALITVKDYGIGISKDNQEKIFQCFERAVHLSEFEGFGLGLYISQQLVNAQGGTIRVDSELGQGTSFIVELPLRSETGMP